MPGYDILVQQLTKWPKLGRHDDFGDTTGMVVAAPTGYELETPPNELPRDPCNWLRRLNSAETAEGDESRAGGSYNSQDPYNTWK